MTKFLLTGGSGFIASHILSQLLQAGHSVVTTVRSESKAAPIRKAYPDAVAKGALEVFLVPDINAQGAFDEVVKSPGIELVLHTASPFHFHFDDPQTELLDPAINGTTGILKAIQASCPAVKRVVITSSFASILDADHLEDPATVFSEKNWNPIPHADIHKSKGEAYRASKTFAEKAAWKFVEDNKPGFDLATICPPLVYGPLLQHIGSLDEINTSNERIVALAKGAWKDQIPPTGVYFWVDVRDVARAHIQAAITPAAGGQRFFITAGYFCHDEMIEIARKHFSGLADKLPVPGAPGGALPPKEKLCGYDNSKATKELGIEWIGLEKCLVDTIKSFDEVEKLGI